MKKFVGSVIITVLLCSGMAQGQYRGWTPLTQEEHEKLIRQIAHKARLIDLLARELKYEFEKTLKVTFMTDGGLEQLKRLFPTIMPEVEAAFMKKHGFPLTPDRAINKSDEGGSSSIFDQLGRLLNVARGLLGWAEAGDRFDEHRIYIELKMVWGLEMPDDVAKQFAEHLHASLELEKAKLAGEKGMVWNQAIKDWENLIEMYRERADGHWWGPIDNRLFNPGWPLGTPEGPGDISRLRFSPHPWVLLWCMTPPVTYVGGPPLPGGNRYPRVDGGNITVTTRDPCRHWK